MKNVNKQAELFHGNKIELENIPSFVWPEPRYHAGQGRYKQTPPFYEILEMGDLISGMVVGANENTVEWLSSILKNEGEKCVKIVLIVYPASPTRKGHLVAVKELLGNSQKPLKKNNIRILPVRRSIGSDSEKMVLPPTVLMSFNSKTGKTYLCIGSIGDLGCDKILNCSFNIVFEPDDRLRDYYRRWFQYLYANAAKLNNSTIEIPHLVPAMGDLAAAEKWNEFEKICSQDGIKYGATKPNVDKQTGEVLTDSDGNKIESWDNDLTKLDPISQEINKVYSAGWLVTIDEATRIKPLTIPVKATLLGEHSESNIGALTRRQSFSLKVLDDSVDKAIEKCRKVTDLMNVLTYSISQGNRFLPAHAKKLLETELNLRNLQGQEALKNALGGNDISPQEAQNILEKIFKIENSDIPFKIKERWEENKQSCAVAKETLDDLINAENKTLQNMVNQVVINHLINKFIEDRSKKIHNDLNEMYQQLGRGSTVPSDKLETVLKDIEKRLGNAFNGRITPRAIYNRISAPDFTVNAPDENWNQPLILLSRSATTMRESFTDPYFIRQFSGLSLTVEKFREACDIFGDYIVSKPDLGIAGNELEEIKKILATNCSSKEKCIKIWHIIKPVDSVTHDNQ
jgi:hypothetical protein